MSRLTEAGEKISETLFNALVINGLPEKYEHFIVQEVLILQQISLNYEHVYKIMMIVDSKEIKQKKIVQQLCILEIRQEETKVQASRREIVLYAETLDISPSNVV